MSTHTTRLRPLLASAALLSAFWATTAHAEEEFPGALADAAGMECVPTCLMCHTVNPGTAGTFTRKVGWALSMTGKLKPAAGDVAAFNEAWKTYEAAAPTGDLDNIKKGIEPESLQNVCSPTYGCGATFARTTHKSSLSSAMAAAFFSLVASLWVTRRRLRGGSKHAA